MTHQIMFNSRFNRDVHLFPLPSTLQAVSSLHSTAISHRSSVLHLPASFWQTDKGGPHLLQRLGPQRPLDQPPLMPHEAPGTRSHKEEARWAVTATAEREPEAVTGVVGGASNLNVSYWVSLLPVSASSLPPPPLPCRLYLKWRVGPGVDFRLGEESWPEGGAAKKEEEEERAGQ